MGDLFRAGRQVRRSRHILQLTGVAAAVAVVTAGGFALQLQHDRDVPTATSTTPTVTKAGAGLVVPDGTRLVGEGDVVVAVPKTWTTNDIVCGGVGSDTVTFNNDSPWATCARADSHASVLSVVDPAARQWDTRLQLTAKKVSVDGMSGLRTPTLCTATPDPTCAGVLTFPEEKVSFAVTSPDDKIVNKVLDSAERLPAGYVTVPDLEGMSAADASQTLAAQGLVMDPPCGHRDHCTFYVGSPTTPPAGSAVAVGSTVTINLPKPASSDHGPLTDREFSVAVAIARNELNQNPPWSVSSVTATVSKGKVLHGNVGAQRHCLSGTLVNIKFIGKFPNIIHGTYPGQIYLPVDEVLVVADPVSGQPCLISVGTGYQAPHPGATNLFARWPSTH
jgi:hypothetical protein